MKSRSILPMMSFLAAVLSFVIALSGDLARAQAGPAFCGQVRYTRNIAVSKTPDNNTVNANLKVSASPCGMYGNVRLASPGGRQSPEVNTDYSGRFGGGQIDITASLPMYYEDGIYVGTAHYKLEDESTIPWSYYPGPGSTQLAELTISPGIAGFVQLVSTAWVPASISPNSGALTNFNVTIRGTTTCIGTTTIKATLNNLPVGATWTFDDVINPQVISYNLAMPPESGVNTTSAFPLTLMALTPANVIAESILSQVPSGCDVKPPDAGSSRLATLEVK